MSDSGYYFAFTTGPSFFFFTMPEMERGSFSEFAMEATDRLYSNINTVYRPVYFLYKSFISDLLATFGDLLVTPLPGAPARQHD